MAAAARKTPLWMSGAMPAVKRTAAAFRRTMSRQGPFFSGEDAAEDGGALLDVAAGEGGKRS